ncbi:2OG-Fe(II) oxygenase, partial [Thioclava sp. BHET1]
MLAAHTIPEAFSAEDCRRIVGIAHEGALRAAGLVGQVRDHNIRRADIAWLDEREGADWVMEKIIRVVAQANRDHFGFDLSDFSESAQ